MTDYCNQGWEPDPRKMGNWRSMFELTRRDGQQTEQPGPSPSIAPAHEDGNVGNTVELDLNEYHPWILQRGRSRPAMMLELRRFEPRSGLWQGWVMPYHSLHAIEYIGEKMLSLDFGVRHFVIEGEGLAQLTAHFRNGSVIVVQEFSASVWRNFDAKQQISTISKID